MHEQTRLQPEIREALDAAWTTEEELGCHLLPALFPRVARRGRWLARPATALLGLLRLAATAQAHRRQPDGHHPVLHGPLAARRRARARSQPRRDQCPEVLRAPENAELDQLLARYEQEPPAIDDYGARDWSELEQRMHYISHLFRCYHEHAELGDPPFTPEQVERFRAGVVPDGDL